MCPGLPVTAPGRCAAYAVFELEDVGVVDAVGAKRFCEVEHVVDIGSAWALAPRDLGGHRRERGRAEEGVVVSRRDVDAAFGRAAVAKPEQDRRQPVAVLLAVVEVL